MKTNMELQRDVMDELEWEPSIDCAAIGVAAHDGVVTLTGNVPNYLQKFTAERVAKRVRGVKAVANDVEVQLLGAASERTDTDIAQWALDALKWKSHTSGDRIKVMVSKGWVTLEGDVDWQYQRTAAEEAVRPVLGVRGVSNLILVKPRASAKDVKSRIEAAFRRSADVDAKHIRVETVDGKVILKGDVRSWAERQEAVRTAWAAPGVSQVEDQIAVLPVAV